MTPAPATDRKWLTGRATADEIEIIRDTLIIEVSDIAVGDIQIADKGISPRLIFLQRFTRPFVTLNSSDSVKSRELRSQDKTTRASEQFQRFEHVSTSLLISSGYIRS